MASPVPCEADNAADEAVLIEPYLYITQVPGKDIRSKLIQAFNVWLKVPEDKLAIINEIMHMHSLQTCVLCA